MVLSLLNRHSFRLLWLADLVLCVGILLTTAYTEIDWKAYMQEVKGFLDGDFVYTNLRGDTGPLVYPAGFVYIFSALYYICDKGRNIALAQWIFMGFYLVLLAVVLKIYNYCKVPFLYTLVLITSTRIHSIFLLRMFNDGVAMMLAYIAVMLFASRRWSMGSIFYSVAVSVKMNIFLFAPGLLCVYIMHLKPLDVIKNLAICATVQLVLGLPFLATDPAAYLGKAFELGRVFDYKWSVNYKFLSEDVFVSKWFGQLLLALTVACWALVCKRRWLPRFNQGPLPYTIVRKNIVLTLFESNLIGFAFCRSMHYQFHVWAFHQIPLVLYLSFDRRLPQLVHLVVFLAFEYAFRTYPSTSTSGYLLMVAAMMPMVVGIVLSRDVLVPGRQDDFVAIGGNPMGMGTRMGTPGSPFDVRLQQQTGPMPPAGKTVVAAPPAAAEDKAVPTPEAPTPTPARKMVPVARGAKGAKAKKA